MRYLLAFLLTFFCSIPGFALTADQLAQFLNIGSWESEVALAPGSFTAEVLEFSDGKLGKSITPTYEGPGADEQNPSSTGGTPILIMWKPEDRWLFLTVTMGLQTRPGLPGACRNFQGPFVGGSVLKSIKEGDYILGGEPLVRDGVGRATNDIKDYKRGFLLRVRKKF